MDKDSISFGPTFHGPVSFVGIPIAISGAFMLFNMGMYIVPAVLLLFGIQLFLSPKGVQIDYTNQRVRSYFSFWGLKLGAWESLTPYTKIGLVSVRTFKSLSSKDAEVNLKIKNVRVWMWNDDFTSQVLLGSLKNEEQANAYLQKRNTKLNLEDVGSRVLTIRR